MDYLSITGQQMNTSQVAVSTPIQLFFAWRIRLLTKSNWLAILICIFAFTSFGTPCISVRCNCIEFIDNRGRSMDRVSRRHLEAFHEEARAACSSHSVASIVMCSRCLNYRIPRISPGALYVFSILRYHKLTQRQL